MGTDDTHGVVVETHPDTVGLTHQEGIFHIDFAIHLWTGGGALDGQFSFAVAFQTNQLVWHETVGNRQRETGHGEACVDVSVALIGTTQQSELLVVEHQTGFHSVGVIFFHQIHQFRADITDG